MYTINPSQKNKNKLNETIINNDKIYTFNQVMVYPTLLWKQFIVRPLN